MKTGTRAALILFVGLLVSMGLVAQKPADLVGTWEGEATIDGMGEPNILTLALELKDGKLTGVMNDQYDTISAEISEVKLEADAFSFTVIATGPNGEEAAINFKMTVEGGSMKGTFEIPDMGMSGNWEATKQ